MAQRPQHTGRIWVYVRDDRPFGGQAPPAVLYYASRDRRGEHPAKHLEGFTGILQADAYSGFNTLCDPGRQPRPITSALCWAHSRRQFFELADIAKNARRGRSTAAISPIALEAVRRIDALFEIERAINGLGPDERLAVRQEQSAPLLTELETWLRAERARLSRSAAVARPSTICSSVGATSPASQRTAGSASPTTQRKEPCAAWPSAENHGCSQVQTVAPNEPPSWSPSS